MNSIIISANNAGVAKLQKGEFEDALLYFKKALETLQQLIQTPDVASSPAGNNTSSKIDHSSCCSRPLYWSSRQQHRYNHCNNEEEQQQQQQQQEHQQPSDARSDRQEPKQSTDSVAYVFERAVILQPSLIMAATATTTMVAGTEATAPANTPTLQHNLDCSTNPTGGTGSSSPYYCSTQFAALLYNFGLTNQLIAKQNHQESFFQQPYHPNCRHLRKALTLYNMAITLIRIETDDVRPRTTNNPTALLEIAILNNMGRIQQDLGMPMEAAATFRVLLRDWVRAEHVQQTLEPIDRNGIFLNLYLFTQAPEGAAAA